MRKSNLVKAMACFMAATMAITCVPSVGVTNSLVAVASADEAVVTEANTTKKEIDATGWWTNFSDYYQLTGDFDITLHMYTEKGSNIWSNPATVFTTPVARGGDGYKEFALVRADGWGWGGGDNLTVDGNAITYENSCGNNWDTFCNAMTKVNLTRNIIRSNNDFTIIDTFTSNGTTYTSTKKFTTDAGDTINIFLVGDQSYTVINSFSGNILSSQRGDISYEDGTYLIAANNPAISGNTIDISKIFATTSGTASISNNIAKFPVNCGADANGNAITKEVTLELLADNPCKTIEPEVTNIKISLNETIELASILTGEKNTRVTELTTAKIDGFQETDANDLIALPEKLRAFFSVDNSYMELKSVTNNKTNGKTEVNKTVGNTEKTTPFFTDFSDAYPLEGDFDITFDFVNHGGAANYNNFLLAITSNADRGTGDYKEYAVIRADRHGWTGNLGATSLRYPLDNEETKNNVYTFDWDWANFPSIMENANVSLNLKKDKNEAGDDIIKMEAKITPVTAVGDKETYTYTATMAYFVGNKNSVAADISDAKRDATNKNRSVHTLTSRVAGKGNIILNAGSAPQRTISYECVNNTCSAISYVVGNGGNVVVNQAGSIAVTAKGKDADVKVNDVITVEDKNGVDVTLASSNQKNGETTNIYYVVSNVATTAAITFKCGTQTTTANVTFKASSGTTTPGTTTPGTTTPGTTTPGTTETPSTGSAITTGSAIEPGDNNKPGDNTPSDNQPGNTENPGNNNETPTPEDPGTTTTAKKKAKVSAVKAVKGKKKVTGTVKISATGKVVKKATVKVYVNNKKKVTATTTSKGKFTAKLSKKLKKGDKVKIVITKSTIKKITKNVTVK